MRILLGLAGLSVAAAIPYGAHSAPHHLAVPICEQVWTTGVLNDNVGPVCVPYANGVTCIAGQNGLDPKLMVHVKLCTPSILGAR